MGFKDALENMKQKRDYEAEIVELKAKLQAAEEEKAKLQSKVDTLERAANATTNLDAALKRDYELQKIIEIFKKELAKLPPFSKKEDVSITERYNFLFVLIDYLVVPVLKEKGLIDLAMRMELISKKLRKDAPSVVLGNAINDVLYRGLESPVNIDFVRGSLSRLIGCDEEIKTLLEPFDKNLQTAQYSKAFIDNVNRVYGKNRYDVIPKDKESIKQWLEMIIGIGTLADDFVASVGTTRPLTKGAFRQVVGLPDISSEKFSHDDHFRSTEESNKVYELLVSLAETYGIDLSKMRVYAGGQNVCEPHYKPVNPIGRERD